VGDHDESKPTTWEYSPTGGDRNGTGLRARGGAARAAMGQGEGKPRPYLTSTPLAGSGTQNNLPV
jgi:hypothetical protein